jgi:hypothetical protein
MNILKPKVIVTLPVGTVIKIGTKTAKVKEGSNRFQVKSKNSKSVHLMQNGKNGIVAPADALFELWKPEPAYNFERFRH